MTKDAGRPAWKDPVLVAAFCAAAAIRVVFMAALPGSFMPFGRYLGPAEDLLHGRWLSEQVIDQLPGAPAFFALCMLVVGRSPAALAAAQHLLGLATFALVVYAARRAWGLKAARWAAVLLAPQLIMPYEECLLLSEPTAELFLAASLALAFAALDDRRGTLAVATGAAAGLAALSRGEMILVGPVLAAALGWRKNFYKGGLALAAWAVLILGWTLHNAAGGYRGFNAHGPTCLLDGPGADVLVRHDLPTYPLAKRLLLEEDRKCEGIPGCSGRLRVFERLQKEHGYTFLQTMQEVGAMSQEAVVTQPGRFLPIFAQNFALYLTPLPWVAEERAEPSSAIREEERLGGAHRAFWRAIESGPQYAAWLVWLLAALAIPAAWRRGADRRRIALLFGVAVSIVFTASVFRAVPRTQAQLLVPLALLAAQAALCYAP